MWWARLLNVIAGLLAGGVAAATNSYESIATATLSSDGTVSFTRMFRAKTPAQQLDHDEGVYGPTPLIAAMRCFVASKLGEEVDVPQELTP